MSTATTGVLICHVYRSAWRTIYLSHSGAHLALQLDMNLDSRRDWEEANVLHEDSPPQAPVGDGLWEMRWPWRNAVHAPTGDASKGAPLEEEYDDDELCCVYTDKPQWKLLVPALRQEE